MTDSAPARKPLPDPPRMDWALLLEMNGVPRGAGHGDKWCNWDAGWRVIKRHTSELSDLQRGMIALMEWLGVR